MAKHVGGRLTAEQIMTTADGLYPDGLGLALRVRGGRGAFVYRYRVGAAVREIGIGSRDDVTIERARAAAERYRQQRAEGIDPLHVKRQEQAAAMAVNSDVRFGEFARTHIENNIAPNFRGAKTANDWQGSIKNHCKPILQKFPRDITITDVEACLRPIWTKHPKTATELRGRIERVLDAAAVKGLRSGENPARWAGGLREIMPRPKRGENHHPSADYSDVPNIVAELLSNVSPLDLSSLALVFTILTAVRSTETRGMPKKEIKADSQTWLIPAARMKMERDFRAPLAPQALAILKERMADLGPDDLVFPGLFPGQMLGENAMNHALARVRDGLTVHGMRASFRTWVDEETEYGYELGELALAHKIGTKVSRAYARSDMLEKRRPMMIEWANFCLSKATPRESK